jgi:hypothetical protein
MPIGFAAAIVFLSVGSRVHAFKEVERLAGIAGKDEGPESDLAFRASF